MRSRYIRYSSPGLLIYISLTSTIILTRNVIIIIVAIITIYNDDSRLNQYILQAKKDFGAA